jgi:GNAT superfamily N-acetyltransferase
VTDAAGVRVRPLAAGDLDEADRICRVAFGTFVGAPQPESFFGDADMVRTRWHAAPGAAPGAEVDGRLAGSNFAANWGSVGFFGPLTVAPEYWDRGVAQRLLDATMELFEAWGTRHAGLFTFAQSAKHVGLYQKYGFWPRFLTAVMSSPVRPDAGPAPMRLSALDEAGRAGAMAAVRGLTEAVYPGLDVSLEIESVLAQGLGDTVLIDDASGLQGVAVCHAGAGTEAGSGTCYVKFGRGFRRSFQGVAMHRPNEPGYSTSDSFVIDDWR